jgi:hypothetical protein
MSNREWSRYVCCNNEKREVAIVEAVLEQTRIDESRFTTDRLSRVNNILRRVLGCWHRHMSLPFTRGNETYRTCVNCGARRRFDLDQWKVVGSFYRPEDRSNSRSPHER